MPLANIETLTQTKQRMRMSMAAMQIDFALDLKAVPIVNIQKAAILENPAAFIRAVSAFTSSYPPLEAGL